MSSSDPCGPDDWERRLFAPTAAELELTAEQRRRVMREFKAFVLRENLSRPITLLGAVAAFEREME